MTGLNDSPAFTDCRVALLLAMKMHANERAEIAPRPFNSNPQLDQCAKIASSSSATMLVILIAGFTAGPAVSL